MHNFRRLDESAIADLSASMLGEAGKQPQVVDLLQRETEGNAFFMVEVVRALAEDAGRLSAIGTMTLPQSVFAGGVQQIVRRRLDRLPAWSQPLLKQAAVAGRGLDLAAIKHLAAGLDSHSIDDWLNVCGSAAVLEVDAENWRFSHDKIRETVVADLKDDEVKTINRQVAEAIETVHPDDESFNEVLLEHWHQADNLNKEISYLHPVVKSMIEITADVIGARELLNRGLDALKKDDLRRASLLNWQAQTYEVTGELDEARTIAQQALELATRYSDNACIGTSLFVLGSLADAKSDYTGAQEFYERSLEIRQKLKATNAVGATYGRMGVVAFRQGDYDQSRTYLEQSLELHRQAGDQRNVALAMNNLGVLAGNRGDAQTAQRYFEQTSTIRGKIGDQRGLAWNLNNLGMMAVNRGDVEQAKDYFERGLHIQQIIGDKDGIAYSLNNLGIVASEMGDYWLARDYHTQALGIRRTLGSRRHVANSIEQLALISELEKKYEEARTLHAQSLKIFTEIGDKDSIAISHALSALVQLQLEDKSALPELITALKLVREQKLTITVLELFIGFALILLRRGETSRAGELLGLAHHHPSSLRGVRHRLKHVLPRLEAALSPEDLEAALERGKSLDLDTVVAELLAEFAPDDS